MSYIKCINESFTKRFEESLYQIDVKGLYEKLRRLTEKEISPEDKADSDMLRSIYKKIDGKKVKLTPQEKEVLDKYGIDAWGFRGDTKIMSPKGNEIIQDKDLSKGWSKSKSFNKINYANRAKKIDDRGYAQKVNADKDRYVQKTFQDSERDLENKDLSKNVSKMKTALKRRSFSQKALNDIDSKFQDDEYAAFNRYKKNIAAAEQELKRAKDYNEPKIKDAQSRITDILNKHKVREYLESINEAEISPEDKRDNELIRSAYNKTQVRSNAKLTPEEIDALGRHGLTRGFGDIRTKNGETIKFLGVENPKLNLVDKVRKYPDREYPRAVRANTYYDDSFRNREREYENDKISADVTDLKHALSNRRYYSKELQKAKDQYTKDLSKHQDELNQKLSRIPTQKENEIIRLRKDINDYQQEIDNLLKKESLNEDENDDVRVVYTGLSGEIEKEILDSVMGQLSDGIWENSSAMQKYWLPITIEDNCDVVISPNKAYYRPFRTSNPIMNPYYHMTDAEIKKFFANKIKYIVQLNLHNMNKNPYTNWNEDCDIELTYMGGHKTDVTVADAYKAYKKLK